MMLSLDRTSQVHKARSIRGLAVEFENLHDSIVEARRYGLYRYFTGMRLLMEGTASGGALGGVLSLGAPDPLFPDLDLLFSVLPAARVIHLVRHPYDCFLSMKSRKEMDSNPYRIGASWLGINAMIRRFCAGRFGEKQYMSLRYEDLVERTETELQRICRWIGVPFDQQMLLGAMEYHGRNENNVLENLRVDQERESLMAMVEHEMIHYGYTPEG
jgi:hypothetical protein